VRLGLREVEKLPSVPFVLFAGAVGGVVQGLSEFVRNSAASALGAFLVLTGAAIVLWWLSVRRRQYAIWSAACQVAVVIGLAQLISLALVIPRVVPANVQLQLRDVATTALVTQLVLSPLRFLEAAVGIALGRQLPGSGRGRARAPAAASADDLDPVT
jgi:cytochrome bd-type quinol oxidase subunit 2